MNAQLCYGITLVESLDTFARTAKFVLPLPVFFKSFLFFGCGVFGMSTSDYVRRIGFKDI